MQKKLSTSTKNYLILCSNLQQQEKEVKQTKNLPFKNLALILLAGAVVRSEKGGSSLKITETLLFLSLVSCLPPFMDVFMLVDRPILIFFMLMVSCIEK